MYFLPDKGLIDLHLFKIYFRQNTDICQCMCILHPIPALDRKPVKSPRLPFKADAIGLS